MKVWTDEECQAHKNKVGESFKDRGIESLTQFENTLIRAAVEEARREEREACAEIALETTAMMSCVCNHKIAAAILARDKEPRE